MSVPLLSHRRPGFGRPDLLWLLGLLVIAATLRMPALDRVPPGYQFDEAYNALDALRVLDGERPIFLSANAGREVLYTYWQAPFVALLGPLAVAGRLASAIPGIATVLLLYLFVRIVFPERSRLLAGMAGLALAVSYWHLHFSRYGIRSITVPFWILLALLLLWLGMRDRRALWYALSGIPLAALVWTHPIGRIVPLVVVGVVLAAVIWDRANARHYALGLGLCGLVAVILFAPLGRYFWAHRNQFLGHASDVSVFSMEDDLGDIVQALIENAVRVALMFNVRGDAEWIHNWPGRPVFDPVSGVPFVLGVALSAWRLVQRRSARDGRLPYLLLFMWTGVILLASVFSDMAPNTSRTIGAAPAVMIFFALGLSWIVERLREGSHPKLGIALAAVVFACALGSTTYDYFVRFGQDPRTPYHYDSDKVQAAQFVVDASEKSTVYLARLWAQQATIELMTRNIDLRSVETNAAVVLPVADDKSLLYCYPPEQSDRADEMAHLWGEWGRPSVTYDDRGEVLLHLFEIDAEHRPESGKGAEFVRDKSFPLGPVRGATVAFEQGITLLGYTLESPQGDANTLSVNLLWQAAQPINGDYTFFLHLFDAQGERVAQRDRAPGDGSYRTRQWRSGDLIIERCSLPLPECLPAGDYELKVGWYHLATGERLLTEGGVADARVGYVAVGGVTLLRGDADETWDAKPGQEIAPGARLLAVAAPDSSEVGRPLDVVLRLAIDETWSGAQADLRLQSDVAALSIARWVLPPIDAPTVVCLSGRSRALGLMPGSYTAFLSARGLVQDITVSRVELIESTRLFDVPEVAENIEVDLDGIALLGASLPRAAGDAVPILPEGYLSVELVWQLRRDTPTSYTVFVHLLDETGRLCAQSDSIPMSGNYPTNRWVPEEVVIDKHTLALPADLLPGRYHLQVGLYDGATGARLTTPSDPANGTRDAITLSLAVEVPVAD